MKPNEKELKLAEKMIKILRDAGFDADGMIKVLRLARKLFEEMKKKGN